MCKNKKKKKKKRKRVVSAYGSETCVTSSTPTSAIIYDAYTKKKTFELQTAFFNAAQLSKESSGQRVLLVNEHFEFDAY